MLPSAKYPFLVDLSKAAVREIDYYGPIELLLEDEDTIRLARERLETILRENEAPLEQSESSWDNIIAFHASLAAAVKSGSLRLLYRVADAEARRVLRLLRGEKLDGLIRIARAMGVEASSEGTDIPWLVSPKGGIVYRRLVASVPADVYLRVASSLGDPKWRLVNSFLLGGRVYLDKAMLEELLAEQAKRLILALAERYRELEVPALGKLGKEYAERLDRERVEVRFDPSLIPECVENALARLSSGEGGAMELYVAATFLANTGAPPEILAEALYRGGLASAPVARVIAEVFMEEARSYTPPRCEVLVEAGLCRKCEGAGPLNEYYSRRRRRGRR